MGDVWKAEDTKLGRPVALKLLASHLLRDEEARKRFHREAQAAAALSHPNVTTIFEIDEADGQTFLALEYVEGETLEQRIEKGPLPLQDALDFARQIAEGLQAAHAKGIVHRDVKPGNILITPDGRVKILDFGLALLTERSKLTHLDTTVGTVVYMSPEQTQGSGTDHRTDIWSLGVVLYEMITGQQPFKGDYDKAVMYSILNEEPEPITALRTGVPMELEVLINKCLAKNADERYKDAGDLVVDFSTLKRKLQSGKSQVLERAAKQDLRASQAGETPVDGKPIWRQAVPLVGAAVGGILLAGLVAWILWPGAELPQVVRFSHDIPPLQRLWSLRQPGIAVAPDGRSFVYNTRQGLYLRTTDDMEARVIPGTEADDLTTPFFSPDGLSVGYFQSGRLKRIAIGGGAPRVIARARRSSGASWASDDTILFNQPEGIVRVSANGGEPEVVIQAQQGERFDRPQLLPNGRIVLFAVTKATWDEAAIVAASLATGERTELIPRGSAARYLSTGHLVYALDGKLFAIAFNPASLTVSGQGAALVEGLMRGENDTAANYSLSDAGTLIYLAGAKHERGLVWVGRDGLEEALDMPPRSYQNVSLSPDGREAALEVAENGKSELWVTELARGTLTRLATEGGSAFCPLWSPDGKRIVFSARRDGLWELRSIVADGTGEADLLARFDETVLEVRPSSWSPDGSTLVFDLRHPDTGYDIGVLSLDEPGDWRPLIRTAGQENKPAVSPDGRWIAYQFSESSQSVHIYVQRFPSLENRRQVSAGSSFYAIYANATWSGDGTSLFYIRVGTTFEVIRSSFREDSAEAPVIGPVELLLPYRFYSSPGTLRTWALSPDEERFLMIGLDPSVLPDTAESRPRIVVVQDWFEELKRLVPHD